MYINEPQFVKKPRHSIDSHCFILQALKFSELAKVTQFLESNLSTIINLLDEPVTKDLLVQLLNRSLNVGHLWAPATALFLGQVTKVKVDILDLCGWPER